jgi:hypothetical protein
MNMEFWNFFELNLLKRYPNSVEMITLFKPSRK